GRQAAAAAASRRGDRTGRPARGRPVLRLRRHLRPQERRGLLGDARGQVPPRRRHRRRVPRRRGQLLPHSHRRRPLPRGRPRAHPLRRDPGEHRMSTAFPKAAKVALGMPQLRSNLAHATGTIRGKRAGVVGELDDWERLRDTATALKADVQHRMPELALAFERNATAAGATVHWARDAAEANAIAARLVREAGADEVVKVKSMATQEIELNEHFEAEGLAAWETDLAELIVQLAEDKPSHILVPAI